MKKAFCHLIVPLGLLALPGLFFSCHSSDPKDLYTAPRAIHAGNFTGSESCKECHEKEYALWMGSHHQLAMQAVNESTVLGDFDDARFESKGITYRFFRNKEAFWVNTEGENGEYRDYQIKYTFGVTPLQQYIIEFDDGRHQCLLAAWDAIEGKWFDLQPSLEIHHSEWMHWTGGSMTWNNMCADCHSTYLEKNYDPVSARYDTRYTEIHVGCEACHGPSDLHVRYYRSEKENKAKGIHPPSLYIGKQPGPEELVEKCARCHSRRSMVTNVFDYQGAYSDHYNPNLILHPTYEKDGQILDEDYVYGSFLQSKMYRNKISCRDCHDMHSMKLKKDGNELCLQCHLPRYNSFEHHFHKMDTEASQCINCHMTGRYYMGNDFRRDHSFRNPRPDQSLVYGTPNACTACHTDKSDRWAADFIREKYGPVRPLHFSDWWLPGQEGNTDSLKSLIQMDTFPEIMRASAVNRLGEMIGSAADIHFLAGQLGHSSPLIRREALLALSNAGWEAGEKAEPLLDDPVRTVRIAAARFFLLSGKETQHPGFSSAREEYLTDLRVNSDFASGQHQWALYHQAMGESGKAREAYVKALKIDNYYNMSRMNLALLEYESGQVKEAEQLYLKVTGQEPEYSYPYFMLGLLYHELGQNQKSMEFLAQACGKEPFLPRAYYNYALKLQGANQFIQADDLLIEGLKQAPMDESLLYVRLIGLMRLDRKAQALDVVNRLLSLSPGNQTYLDVAASLQSR